MLYFAYDASNNCNCSQLFDECFCTFASLHNFQVFAFLYAKLIFFPFFDSNYFLFFELQKRSFRNAKEDIFVENQNNSKTVSI